MQSMIAEMTSEEYYSHPALSHSRLKLIERSPAHFRHWMEHQKESTDALDFGRLFHASILEPETVATDFTVAPDVDRRTKAGKEEYAKFLKSATGKTVVSAADLEMVGAMSASISTDDAAKSLVFEAVAGGRVEEAHLWRDQALALEMKAKADAIIRNGVVIDLKTTTDASPSAFASSIARYGYHTQAAFYARAVRAAGMDFGGFIIIAVEKTPPYAVGVYQIDSSALAAGEARIQRWLSTYVDCLTSNTWPGYTSGSVRFLSLPAWMKKEDQNEEW